MPAMNHFMYLTKHSINNMITSKGVFRLPSPTMTRPVQGLTVKLARPAMSLFASPSLQAQAYMRTWVRSSLGSGGGSGDEDEEEVSLPFPDFPHPGEEEPPLPNLNPAPEPENPFPEELPDNHPKEARQWALKQRYIMV